MDQAGPHRFVAYFRVSTTKQGHSGLGLEAQQSAVERFVTERHSVIVASFVEVERGGRSDRPKLIEALRLCRVHSATLAIAKLDRLARNVAFISHLMDGAVDFVAVDFPMANRLTLHILAAVAEHEAHIIQERTRTALTAAKARGVRLGGDRGNLPSVSRAGALASARTRHASAQRRADDLRPIVDDLVSRQFSLRAIARELTHRSIPAPRGGTWGPSQVYRLLQLTSASA